MGSNLHLFFLFDKIVCYFKNKYYLCDVGRTLLLICTYLPSDSSHRQHYLLTKIHYTDGNKFRYLFQWQIYQKRQSRIQVRASRTFLWGEDAEEVFSQWGWLRDGIVHLINLGRGAILSLQINCYGKYQRIWPYSQWSLHDKQECGKV